MSQTAAKETDSKVRRLFVFAEIGPFRWEVWNSETLIKHVTYGDRAQVTAHVAKLESAYLRRGRETNPPGWKAQQTASREAQAAGRKRGGRPKKKQSIAPSAPTELAADDLRRFLPTPTGLELEKEVSHAPGTGAVANRKPADEPLAVEVRDVVSRSNAGPPLGSATARDSEERLAADGAELVRPPPTESVAKGEVMAPVAESTAPFLDECLSSGRPLTDRTKAIESAYLTFLRERGAPPRTRALARLLGEDPNDLKVTDRLRNTVRRGRSQGRLPRLDGSFRTSPSHPRAAPSAAALAAGLSVRAQTFEGRVIRELLRALGDVRERVDRALFDFGQVSEGV